MDKELVALSGASAATTGIVFSYYLYAYIYKEVDKPKYETAFWGILTAIIIIATIYLAKRS